MGYNIYKQMNHFKNDLEKKRGNLKNLTKNEFGKALMLYFGMRKKTAVEWIDNFVEVGIISIDNGFVKFQ